MFNKILFSLSIAAIIFLTVKALNNIWGWFGKPKHVCAWCGKSHPWLDNAHKSAKLSFYAPCPDCMDKFRAGVVLFEAVDKPTWDNQPPVKPGVYPTGRYVVLDVKMLEHCPIPEIKYELDKKRMAYISQEAMDYILKNSEVRA